MLVRAIARLAILAGFVVLTGAAGAQYYPAPPGAYPPNSRMPAPPADDDDDVEYLPPPPGVYGRSSASAPYPTAPSPDESGTRGYGAPVEQQALPAPGTYAPPQGRLAPGPGYQGPGYQGPAYEEPGYQGPGPAGAPYDGRVGARAPYGSDPGPQPMRPPADISPPQQGAILDLNRGPGQPMGQPPASVGPNSAPAVASLPPDYQPETGERKELPPNLRRQLVDYVTREPAGTIVIDTPNTYLYMVLGNGKAMRYGIGVGREGFTWNGTERISRMAEWPDWHPPSEMIERQPYLPRFMAGGESNPLGARALYLGKTLYRIHGTNQPSTIGTFVSSGCIRLVNEDIEDLYSRVQVGTRVVVLPGRPPASASAAR